ncbi:MAG: hypothetical protein RLZZ227_1985 [Pseudomonadota bacterium]|jgi:hypothetical protein
MKSAAEALSKIDRIRKLSSHLQSDLLQISGKAFGHRRHFSLKLLVPVALVIGAGVLLAISPKTRNSLLVRTGVLLVTRYVKDLGERDDPPELEDEQPKT